jgi:hypothetical protein
MRGLGKAERAQNSIMRHQNAGGTIGSSAVMPVVKPAA